MRHSSPKKKEEASFLSPEDFDLLLKDFEESQLRLKKEKGIQLLNALFDEENSTTTFFPNSSVFYH